jgi:hypothetical protein
MGRISMKTMLGAAGYLAAVLLGTSAAAQAPRPGQPPTQADIAAAQALFAEMDPACSNGPQHSSACGVLIYSPEDCAPGKTDGHVRQVYQTYDDHTVRYQQANTGVARTRPMALLAPFGIFGRNGKNTQYANPRFVSHDDYRHGMRKMSVCGRDFQISGRDFDLLPQVSRFLKANP